jgi:hypothetical protein
VVTTVLGDAVVRDVGFSLISGGEPGGHCVVFLFLIEVCRNLEGLNSESMTSVYRHKCFDCGEQYGLLDSIVVKLTLR